MGERAWLEKREIIKILERTKIQGKKVAKKNLLIQKIYT